MVNDPANWRDGGGTFDAAPRPDRSTRQGESYAVFDARRRAYQDAHRDALAKQEPEPGFKCRSWQAPASYGPTVERVVSKKAERSPEGRAYELLTYRDDTGRERLVRRLLVGVMGFD